MDVVKGFIFQDFGTSSPAHQDGESDPQWLTVAAISVLLLRLAQWCGRRVPWIAGALKQLNHVITGADIAWRAEIGPGLRMNHPTGVVIGPHARIGPNCILQSGVTIGGRGLQASPVIGSDVLIGSGAKILGPVRIGDRCVVGANAVVVRDVAAGATVAGVPARPL